MSLQTTTTGRRRAGFWLAATLALAGHLGWPAHGQQAAAVRQTPPGNAAQPTVPVQPAVADALPIDRALLNRYCVTCHNDKLKIADLSLMSLDPNHVEAAPAIWEKVALKLRTASMPPPGRPRPDKAAASTFVAQLEAALDRADAEKPNPGTPGIHRLNRTQYTNAIRDLLSVELEARRSCRLMIRSKASTTWPAR